MSMPINRRVFMILSVILVIGSLGALVLSSFTGALVYFHTPTEALAKQPELNGKKIRIGGMVQAGTLTREAGTLKIRFLVTDGKGQIPVRYEGIVPDLFREGQGVVVEGTWKNGQDFPADTILAKHSEDYVPVEMNEQGIAKSKESLLKSLK
ncbi:Cytochrome c-type biogenesis protein CcmE [Candidatus Magnetaquicoccaceae bacterium FCR-1]|uniref:Cytochrome c-type biogenesis protein CcmE n=1 Tax=Candidatus Magnetaquiglobus chichijimensis TaxID=3141448 RepID=A0ABQ0CBP0_9PROT